MAMSKDHIYQETEIEVECQEEIFKAKGKIVLQDGWKLFENCFKNKDLSVDISHKSDEPHFLRSAPYLRSDTGCPFLDK